jgi:putative acetyltransferase
MQITNESPVIEDSIRHIVSVAFGRPNEAILVDMLRHSGDLVASRVALDGEEVVGHVALSRLKSPPGGVALAPLAVVASHRRQGIASALVKDSIAIARRAGHDMIFVLGDPDYYARFGFTAGAAQPFASQFSGPHLMAIQLADIAPQAAELEYAEPFDDLE